MQIISLSVSQNVYLPFCIVENQARLARSGACGTAGVLSRGAAIKHFNYHHAKLQQTVYHYLQDPKSCLVI